MPTPVPPPFPIPGRLTPEAHATRVYGLLLAMSIDLSYTSPDNLPLISTINHAATRWLRWIQENTTYPQAITDEKLESFMHQMSVEYPQIHYTTWDAPL